MRLSLASLLAAAAITNAATIKWDGGTNGTGTAWSTNTNWVGDVLPTLTDDILFDNSVIAAPPTSSTISADMNVKSITFSNNFNATNTILIGNGGGTARTLTFGSGWSLTNNATTGTVTFQPINGGTAALGINLTGNGTISVASGGTLVLSTIISSTVTPATVTKSGLGTLKLAAANTYSGGTVVSAGTLNLDFSVTGAPATNILASSAGLTLAGGTLQLTGKASTTNSQTVSGLTLNAGASGITLTANATANPLLLSVGAITRSIGSTVNLTQPTGTLSATNGFITSSTNTNGILGGWATVGGANWAVAGSGTAVTAYSGYTVQSGTWSSTANMDVQANVTVGSDLGANSLRFNTAAATTVTLAGNNAITSGGILVGSTVGNNLTTITGGTITGSASGDLIISQNNTSNVLTIASVIANNVGATALTKSGAGTLTLSGTNTYTGQTYVNQGSLTLGTVGSIGTGALNFGLGAAQVLTLLDTGSAATANNIALGTTAGAQLTLYKTATSSTVGTWTFSGVVSGGNTATTILLNQSVADGASAVFAFTGANTFTASTITVNRGAISLGNAAALGNSANVLKIDTYQNVIDGALRFTTGMTVANPILLSYTAVGINTNANNVTLTGVVSGAQQLVKLGTGTLTLQSASTMTAGGVKVSRGTLNLDFSAATAPTTNFIASSLGLTLAGGTLQLTGKASTTNSQTFAGMALNPGASGITLTANATTNPLLLSVGAITRSVGGTVNLTQPTGTLSATNGFITSSTNTNGILGGWATVGGTDWAVAGSSTAVTAYTGYTLQSGTWSATANMDVQANITVGSALGANSIRFNNAGARTVTLAGTNAITSGGILVTSVVGNNLSTITGGTITGSASGDLVVNQNNTSNGLTIASVIANNGGATALTKSGAGTLTLTGTNTYTGQTYFNQGNLSINAAAAISTAALNIALPAAQTLTVATTSDVTLSNAIVLGLSGASATTLSLIKNSTGSAINTLTLSGVISGGNLNTALFLNTSTGGDSLTVFSLTGANTFVAPTITLNRGAINLGTSTGLGNAANQLVIDSNSNLTDGSLRFSANNLVVANSIRMLITTGISVTGTNTATLTGTLTGTGALVKIGSGTLNLQAAETYTAGTSVNAGILNVDFSGAASPTSNILPTGYAVSLAGGTLQLTGKASTTNSQTTTGLTLNAGASAITLSANATANPLLLSVGAITRNIGSTVNLTQPTGTLSATNGFVTSSTNTNGILGGWATVGGTDWAVAGSSTAVTAYTGYTLQSGTWSSTANMDVQADITVGADLGANSLRFNTAAATTVTLAGTNAITSGGILVGSTVGNNLTTITGGTITGSASGDLIVLQNNTLNGLTIGSVIANNGGATALTKSGAGTLTLSGTNTYTGATYVNQGALAVGSTGQLGAGNYAGAITLAAGTTFQYAGSSTQTLGGAIAIASGATFQYAGSSNLTLGGAVTGLGTVSVAGTANLVLGTGSSIASTTAVTMAAGSTLEIASNQTLASTLTLSGNATIQVDSGMTLTRTGGLAGGKTLTFSGSGATTLSGYNGSTNFGSSSINVTGGTVTFQQGNFNTNISLSSVTVGSGATVNLSSAHSLGGAGVGAPSVTVNGGTLNFNYEQYLRSLSLNGATITGASGKDVRADSGGLTIAVTGGLSSWSGVGLTPTSAAIAFNIASGAQLNLSGSIAAGGGYAASLTGGGTLAILGANALSGGMSVTGSTLNVANLLSTGGTGGVGTGALSLSSSTLNFTSSATQTATTSMTVTGDTTFGVTDALGSLTLNGLNAGAALTQNLTKTGAGTLILGNTIAGSSAVSAQGGTLSLSAVNTFTGGLTIANDATVVVAQSGSSSNGAITLGGTGGTLRVNTDATATHTTLSGTGSFAKSGAGSLSFSGTNALTGNIAVQAGALSLTGADSLGHSGTLTVSSGASLAVGASVVDATTSGAISNAGTVSFAGTTARAVTNTGTFTNTGTISGNLTMTAGTLTSSGTLGSVDVSNGTAQLSGNAGAITLSNTALVVGSATSTGSLSASSLTLGNYSSLELNLADTSNSSFYSHIDLAGALDLSALTDTIQVKLYSFNRATNSRGLATAFNQYSSFSLDILTAGSVLGSTTLPDPLGEAQLPILALDVSNFTNTYTGTWDLVAFSGGYRLQYTANIPVVTVDLAVLGALGDTAAGATFLSNLASGDNGYVLRKVGAGQLTITETLTHLGGTQVNGGVLNLANGATLGDGSVTVANGATLQLSNAGTMANDISGGGDVVKLGAGSLTLSGNVGVSGTFSVQAGQLVGNLASVAGTLEVLSGSSAEFAGASNATFSGRLSGAGTALLTNGTTLTLSSASTDFTGLFSVSNGRLVLAANSALGSGTANIASGAFLEIAGARSVSNAITGAGSLVKTGSGTATLAVASDLTGGITVSGGTLKGDFTSATGAISVASGAVLEYAVDTNVSRGGSDITGSGSFSKSGVGTLTLSSALGNTGSVLLAGGTLRLGVASALSSATSVSFSGGTLDVGTNNTALAATTLSAGAIQGSGALTFASLALSNDSAVQVSASSSVTGSLIKSGSGQATFAGALVVGGATTISAGKLTVGDGSSFTGAISLTGGTLEFANANSLSVSNVLSGAGSLVKSGAGTLTLSGVNTYTGGTTVSAGTLAGTTSSILRDITNNATVTFSQSSNGTYAGAMSGTGVLTKEGAGVLTLSSSANTFSGGININAGAIILSNASAAGTGRINIGTGATSLATYASGGSPVITLGSASSFTLANDIALPDPASTAWYYFQKQTVGSTGTYAGNISGGGANLWIQIDTSTSGDSTTTQVLSGNNTFVGSIRLNRGRLILASETALGNASNLFRFASNNNTTNGNVVFGLAMTLPNPIEAASNGTINVQTYDVTLSGAISSTAGWTKIGTGRLSITSASNTYNGALDIREGSLELGGSGVLGATAGSHTAAIANAGSLIISTSANQTFSGVISGAGNLVMSGSGKLTLSGANTFTGGLAVNSGTLEIGGAGSLGSGTYSQNIAFGTGTTLAYSSSANQTLSGALTGGFSITKSGTGVLTLSGANSFSGGTTIGSSGAIAVSNESALGSGAITVLSTAAYGSTYTSGGSPFLSIVPGTSFNLANNIVLPSAAGFYAIQRSAATGTAILSGVISGGGSGMVLQLDSPINSNSTSTIQIDGANTFVGTLRLNRGCVILNNLSALGDSSNQLWVQTNSNATDGNVVFNVAGTFANPVNVVNAGNALNTLGNDVTLSGVISGAGTIAKLGSGNLTLTGTNTYSGGLTVSAGTVTGNTGSVLGAIANSAAVVFNQASDGTYAGAMSGGGSLTKNGSGVLTFSGTNSYTGGLNVNSGTVVGSVANAFGGNTNVITLTPDANDTKVLIGYTVGAYQAVTVTGSGAGTAVIGAVTNASIGLNTQYYGTITLGRDVSLLAGSADRLTFSGKITGTGDITIATPSTTGGRISWIQSTSGAANDFVGNITIGTGAQLQVGVASNTNNYAIPDAASIYFDASSSYLRISGSGGTAAESVNALISNTDGAGLIQATESAATLTIGAGNGSGTFSGVIGNNQVLNLVKAGSGTQVLSGANTFTGTLGITGGTLEIGGAGKLGNGTYAAAITNAGALVFSTSANQTLSGVISGVGSLTKSGNGTLTLSGTNTYSGGTTVSAGTLALNAIDSLTGPINIGSGGTLALNIVLDLDTAFDATLSGTGILRVNNLGSSVLSLGSAAGFSGGTVDLYAGVFDSTGFAGRVRLLGGSLLSLDSYTGTLSVGPNLTQAEEQALATFTGTLELGSGATLDVTKLNATASLVVGAGATVDLTGASPTDLANRTITLAGNATLQGADTFTGTIQIASGSTVSLATVGLGTAADLVVSSGATLDFTGASSEQLSRTITLSGTATLQGASDFTGTVALAAGSNVTISAGSIGGGTLEVSPSATVVVSSPITNTVVFAGGTILGGSNLSTLELGDGNLTFGAGGNIDALGASSTLKVGGGTVDFAGQEVAGTVQFSGGAITGGANFTGTVAVQSGAALSNSGTLGGTVQVTSGASVANTGELTGTVALSGGTLANAGTISGTLAVTSGTVVNNGTVTGETTVGTGGALSGNGTLAATTISTGGSLNPGSSPGKLTFTDTLALSAGSTWQVQIYSDVAQYTSGVLAGKRGYDTIEITSGGLDLSDVTLGSHITLSLMTLQDWADATAGVPTQGNLTFIRNGPNSWVPKDFVLATYTGQALLATGQNITSVFAIDINDFYYETGVNAASIPPSARPWGESFWVFERNLGGGQYELTLRVVPEPSTYGMILGGIALAAAALRRRNKLQPKPKK